MRFLIREKIFIGGSFLRQLYAFVIALFAMVSLHGCADSKKTFDPEKKFAPHQLQSDYSIFRHIMEENHPGLYWYTSKDSMDYYFDRGFNALRDSMSEKQFLTILSFVTSKINCGHTAVKQSRQLTRYYDTAKIRMFPLNVKCWQDTVIVTANIIRNDSILKRGLVLKSIEGHDVRFLMDTMFNYISGDGYNKTGKYQSLSSSFTFGYWYASLFGLPDSLHISYIDAGGTEKFTTLPVYQPSADTSTMHSFLVTQIRRPKPQSRKKQFLFATRNLQIDSTRTTAIMTVNTFSNGNELKRFFRQSFATLRKQKVPNLIVDVRSNGGGDAGNSTLLTKFLIDKPFKLADSLYAVNRKSKYQKYIHRYALYRMLMGFVTKKRDDGHYHFGYFERHYFKPKKRNHFDGNIYLLTGGNSFSATTLFAGALKGQHNVTLIGEETGGGNYGNTAWIIPDAELPNTGIRFRLPKFRLVIDKNRPKDGRGIMPDVQALPSVDAIRHGIDFKTEKAKALIAAHKSN